MNKINIVDILKPDKKFRQKIEKLSLKKDFVSQINQLKIKFSKLINERSEYTKLMLESFNGCFRNGIVDYELLNTSNVKKFHIKSIELLLDKKVGMDTINLAKRFKLYPSEEWSNVITFILFDSNEKTSFLEAALYTDPLISQETRNCVVYFKKNSLTDENELFIKIYSDTSLEDIKNSWNIVMQKQNKIREHCGTRRYYPVKNLEIAKKIEKLDNQKVSDWEIQEDIYGATEGLNFGKEEIKKKARVRQIRHRSK